MGPMRTRAPLRVYTALTSVTPIAASDQIDSETEKRLGWWIEKVGENRARAAQELLGEKTGSRTLPELLTEIYLRSAGVRYRTQLDLGFARPDFAVWQTKAAPDGVLILRVQGEYWHGRAPAVVWDASQKDLLLQTTAEGSPIRRVIDVWENDIYASEDVLVRALAGEEIAR